MNPTYSDDILAREQNFFDHEAAGLINEDLRIPTDQIERYRHARLRPSNIPKDTLFASLGSLEGKRILDYGCGHGENACLFAACGAQVTAFDLSPLSIATAQRRAEIHGLADRIQFDTRRAGETGYPPSGFDFVIGEAILHHLHTDLATIYAEIDHLLSSTGCACFIEPVANSPVLRTLRRWIPVKTDTTPDERQLVYQDFEPLQQYFSEITFHHFYCLERLHRLLGPRIRRRLRLLDHHAQRLLPVLRPYYGTILVIARR